MEADGRQKNRKIQPLGLQIIVHFVGSIVIFSMVFNLTY